jgi:hypothetical protein
MIRPSEREVVDVDVREDLRNGREPFSRIMTSARALGDDQVMHLRAIFKPVPLFDVLQSIGLKYEVESHASDDWSVWCWRPAA